MVNNVAQTSAIALERNTGGNIYYQFNGGLVGSPFQLWKLLTASDTPQAVNPISGAVGNVFTNLTTGQTYRTARAMIGAAVAGDVLQIPMMPSGLPMWWDAGNASVANLVIQATTGSLFGGDLVLGQASIVATANNLTVKNASLAYGDSGAPESGIRQDTTFFGLTVQGCTIDHYDHGILTGASTGGTTTVRDTTISNCGDLSGSNTHGSTHNAYIGSEDHIDVQNVTSYRTISGGHCWKTRAKSGNLGHRSGCIFAQLGGDSTACIDIPCGGTYTVKNSILHRGPNVENNRFTTFGVEIALAGFCDMTGIGGTGSRGMSLVFDGCWFIDDGPLNSSATQICQNAFAQTGVNVTLQNKCKIVSNPNTSAVVFGPNVTDDGTTIHYASRAAAITAGENIPASYSDSLSCLPPIPAPDPIAGVLATMASNSWKKISLGTTGNFATSVQPRDRVDFDAGTTWASDAAVAQPTMAGVGDPTNGSVWAFSKGAIRDDGQIYFIGGGHVDSGIGSLHGFSVHDACADVLIGSGGTWRRMVDSARYLDQFTQSRPAWSNQSGGAAPTGPNQQYWASDNKAAIHMPPSFHSYGMCCFIPGNNKFHISGGSAFSNDGNARIGSAFAFDDQNLYVNSGMIGPITFAGAWPSAPFNQDSLLGYAQYTSTNVGGTVVGNDQDGLLYTYGQMPNANNALWRISNPYNSANISFTRMGFEAISGGADGTLDDAIMFPDPVNGPTKRAYLVKEGTGNDNLLLWTNIASGGAADSATFNRPHTSNVFPTTVAVSCRGWTYNSTANVANMTDGVDIWDLSLPSTIISGNAATWSKRTTGATGDIPAPAAGANLPRLKHLASQNCYVLVNTQSVWLYKS